MERETGEDTLVRIITSGWMQTHPNPSKPIRSETRGPYPYGMLHWGLEGIGEVWFEGRKHLIPPGNVFITVAPEICSYAPAAESPVPWVTSWVKFRGDLALGLLRVLRKLYGLWFPMPADSPAGIAFNRLVQAIDKVTFQDSYDASANAYAFFMTLRRQLAYPENKRRGAIIAAVEHVRLNFRDPFTVKELANRYKVSREHLSRCFIEEVGVSPALFLRNLRVEHASRLINDSSLSLRLIAKQSGFGSLKKLRHAYRRVYGKDLTLS
jgi:AraC-like DNA-binding protein